MRNYVLVFITHHATVLDILRDCSKANVLVDWSSVYPDRFRPAHQDTDPSGAQPAKCLRRSDAEHVKYYFIDFGHSFQFLDPSEPRLVLGAECRDRRVPELSEYTPYYPLPVDIHILGDLYGYTFVWVRKEYSVFHLRLSTYFDRNMQG